MRIGLALDGIENVRSQSMCAYDGAESTNSRTMETHDDATLVPQGHAVRCGTGPRTGQTCGFGGARVVTAEAGPFVHPALFYRTDEEYLAGLVPFVTDGVAAGHPVAVAVPGERLALLRAALGGTAEDITMIDMRRAGRNPGRIIVTVLRRFADTHTGMHVRIIGEPIWPGRTATEYPACVQHEALINHAFAGRDVTIVCPYDTGRLDEQVVADAHATHPEIWRTDHRHRSDRYAPDDVTARYNLPLDADAPRPLVTVTQLDQLRAVRGLVLDRAGDLGLTATRLGDLELIVNELVVNSLVHGGGTAELRLWTADDHVVCEVSDPGRMTDPLAGRRPPAPGQQSGRGLLLVHGLADLVRTHTTDKGTTIRAYLHLDHP
jgi:anti-sigma regulatory factor (Ser/Thr protein kinase)